MMDFLYSIDLTVFYFFNHTLSVPALDRFFSVITSVNSWYIAYIILLGISWFKGGVKGKVAVIGVLLLITATDQLGYKVLKEIFMRERPCIALSDVLTPTGCNGTFAFPSNHAINNFAAATFFWLLFPRLKWVLFITASLIAISRVYLGLHYPSDIIAGALIGFGFGYFFGIGALKLSGLIEKKKAEKVSSKGIKNE